MPKRNNGQPLDTAYDWRDVEVISEPRRSTETRKRRFSRSADTCGMWSPVNQRAGMYTHLQSTGARWRFAFNIHEEPERFIQVIAGYTAGRAIHGYQSIPELLAALRDAIKAHRSLYLKATSCTGTFLRTTSS